MDAKITKKRLSAMLSYDWWKIVLAAAALIVAWMLVFTTTATRIKPSQQFTIGNYMGNDGLSTELSGTVYNAKKDNAFSYEVLETGAIDFALDESAAAQLLEARIGTNELDVMFVSTQAFAGRTYEWKQAGAETETRTYTYLESFLGGYFPRVHNLGEGGYFDQMAAYLNGFYGDYTDPNATLDTEKAEQAFRTRAKGDKRYKTEEQKQAGVQGEIERIEKYRASLLKFDKYLEDGAVSITLSTYMVYDETTEQMTDILQGKGYYSINICPDSMPEAMRVKLANFVGYYPVDEEGNEGAKTAKDMQLCLLDSNGGEEAYRYEGLNYLCYLLDSLQA